MRKNDYCTENEPPVFRSDLSETEIEEAFAGVDFATALTLALEEALRYERGEPANVIVVKVEKDEGKTSRTQLQDYTQTAKDAAGPDATPESRKEQ